MNFTFHDLTNQRFGRWTVLSRAETKNHQSYWNCKCDCGTLRTISSSSLVTGKSKSCGCYQKEVLSKRFSTHNLTNTRLYNIYHNMKSRCYNPNNPEYSSYGGKGVAICDEWLGKDGLTNFAKWSLVNNYNDNLTIDRIDVDGNYEPSNCRWTTYEQQASNKSVNHLYTYKGETHNITEWSRITGIKRETLYARIRYGWDEDRIFNSPQRRKRS